MKQRANISSEKGNRATVVALFLFYILFVTSCSTATRQLFFDIPAPSAEDVAEEAQLDQQRREATLAKLEDQPADSKSLISGALDADQPRPDIESLTTWEQVEEALPKDYKKQVDWAAAYEQGLVKPRSGSDPMSKYAAAFRYDFIIESENPKNEAYFPHSAHTPWLGCKNCHVALYPYKRNPTTMKEMRKGASCGACHEKVAFSLKQCKRCHLNK